jgi:hypothetical protein
MDRMDAIISIILRKKKTPKNFIYGPYGRDNLNNPKKKEDPKFFSSMDCMDAIISIILRKKKTPKKFRLWTVWTR